MTTMDLYINKMFTPPSDWEFDSLGTIFSIAVDKRGDIFVAASTVFGSVPFPDGFHPSNKRGSGSIYKIDGSTGGVNKSFVTTEQYASFNPAFPNRIPNVTMAGMWGPNPMIQFTIKSGPGLGDLTYNKFNDFIYICNFEDGHIYKINPFTGQIEFDWDPRFGEGNPSIALDNGSIGFATRGQRPWGLGVAKIGSQIRLYYSNWKVDARERNNSGSEHNEIWSVELDNIGNPVGPEKLEIVIDFFSNMISGLPAYPYSSSPVSDISFSENGAMLLAEKGMESDFGYVFGMGCGSPVCNSAHQARLLQYTWNGTTWQIFNNPKFYELASTAGKTNSAGGVDVGYNTCDPKNACDSLIWVTGDFNRIRTNVQVYGYAGIEFGNGNANNHRYVDFNGQINNSMSGDPDKLEIGDVEIFRCDLSCINCCDSVIIYKTDSCCSHLESTCEVKSINISVAYGTISDLFWNCGTIPSGYLGSTNFTYTPTVACPLALDLCVNANGLNSVIITYTITFIDGSTCIKTETKNCPCAFITGEAWYDANGDGIYQQIENGINGMLIQLVDAMTGKTVSTMETITRPGTSSDDGYYEFPCVKPGMYYIRFDSLAGFTTSTPFQGGNAETDSDITGTYDPYTTYKITVMNGDTINNIDGGYKDSTSVNIGHLTIAGLIITEATKAMLPSRVNLATVNNSNYKTEWSHYSGNYAFSDLTAGQDYRISVENNESPLQGVSTRDIVLIQKHILGIKYLDSPYKIIAADVNSSQSITASDLAEIRKLILGVIETFPKNKSWRFVPKNYVFKNPAYPFPFEENILHSKMENNKMNTDFYAVKIGDVSGNALGLVNTTTRSIKNVQLIFEKASYKKNEEISVPIRISEGDMLSGIQIALQCSDELEFVSIEKGSLNINQENYRFNRGQLLISYNDGLGFDVSKKDIFTLKLKAKTDLNIDKKINSSNLLENEAYDLADQVIPLEVISSVENIKTTSGVYKFYPAKPNPFKQETMIEFELPNEEAIIFTVYNPEGKLVWSKEKIYISGNNQISISKEDLGHFGLYYLHIQSKEFCKTQRILMLD